MRNKCTYCFDSIFDAPKVVCQRCEEQVKKLDQEMIDWLIMVIDSRVYKEINEHTDRYEHESSSRGYY